MNELLLILVVIGAILYFINQSGSSTKPPPVIENPEPKFKLSEKVMHNDRKAYIYAIWKRRDTPTHIAWSYVIVYIDVWKRSLVHIPEAEITLRDQSDRF